jgi:hypothetical protein
MLREAARKARREEDTRMAAMAAILKYGELPADEALTQQQMLDEIEECQFERDAAKRKVMTHVQTGNARH